MQVASRPPLGLYHAHPPQAHINGTHSDLQPRYSPSPTSASRDDEMHPYQQHYAAGQRGQYPNNQLPPMYPGMPGQPGQSNVPQAGGMYNQMQPGQHAQPPNRPPPGQQGKQPLTVTGCDGKYNYELRVEQQPQRARMCGFGDKDRRPITPPPCIRLIITDLNGNRVGHNPEDGQYFVLSVDLWDDEATREVNIVRSSSTSPAVSISTATTTSYPPVSDRTAVPEFQHIGYTPEGQPLFQPPRGYPASALAYYPQLPPGPGGPAQYAPASAGGHQQQNTSMYTRNLIGSLSVNASILKDPDGNESFWFVLQDLSVRTEGWFRLKMNFFDLGNPNGDGLNKDKCPVLAYVFSDKFQVYSAKKFPGVIESTPLSKCFAQQGIKIPIRKDMRMEEVVDED